MPKTKGLYLPNGYLDIDYFDRYPDASFIFIIGGRGTGKTYSGFKKSIATVGHKFLYARRTDRIIKSIINSTMDPMAPVARDMGVGDVICTTVPDTQGALHAWYHCDNTGKPTGDPIGLAAGLATFGNIRSFDMSDITDYINDEFIKEPQMVRFADNEAYTYWNSVETINRNRELNGGAPVKCWLFSNSENIANDYFIDLKAVDILDRMRQQGQEVYYDRKRGIVFCYLMYSPISEAKKQTALYRATVGTSFYEMSVGNEFVNDPSPRIRSRDLREYRAVVAVKDMCVYRNINTGEYYVSLHKQGSCRTFSADAIDLRRFRKWGADIFNAYMQDAIIFESLGAEAEFRYFMLGN